MSIVPYRQAVKVADHEIVVREFPPNTTIHIKEGETIFPETIIADYMVSGGFQVFHLPKELGIAPKHAAKALKKRLGDRIYKGEVLASNKGIFSFKHKTLVSPVDGTLQALSERGDVTISILPLRVTQPSLYWGKVAKLVKPEVNPKPNQPSVLAKPIEVHIETQVLTLFGVMGSGKRREGRITIACDASDFLLPQQLTAENDNTIIIGGALIEHGLLEAALKLGVSGILGGGIHLRDATALGMKTIADLSLGTDVGVSLLITEGFGSTTINSLQFRELAKFNGRYGVIDGNYGIVQVPLKPQEVQSFAGFASNSVSKTKEATVGMKVRVIGSNAFGMIGTITEISQQKIMLESKLSVFTVTVKPDGDGVLDPVTVPLANIEAIG